MKMRHLILISSLLSLTINSTVHAEEQVAYPTGYRHWTHVKTLVLHDGHPLENPFKGIHHIYANEEGVKGIQGGQYKDGAIIVFDLLEYVTENKASSEGRRKLTGVMVRDQNKYASTGGWGFEAWNDSKRLTNDKGTSCFACHASQKDNQFVFSKWRD